MLLEWVNLSIQNSFILLALDYCALIYLTLATNFQTNQECLSSCRVFIHISIFFGVLVMKLYGFCLVCFVFKKQIVRRYMFLYLWLYSFTCIKDCLQKGLSVWYLKWCFFFPCPVPKLFLTNAIDHIYFIFPSWLNLFVLPLDLLSRMELFCTCIFTFVSK